MKADTIDAFVLRNILKNMPVGLMVIDRDGLITVTNSALTDILGLSRDLFPNKGWGQIFFDGPAGNVEFNQVIIDVITKETESLRRTVPYQTPDGAAKMLCTVSSYLIEEGEVAGIVILIQDVTEMHEMHEREKEMLSRVNALQEEKVKSLDALAMSVAHQVRNPTSAIGGFAARLLRSAPSEAEADSLEVILEQTKRLELIVRAVGEYASLPGPAIVRVKLKDMVARFTGEMDQEARDRGMSIAWDVQVDGAEVEADPDLLSLALRELVRNCLDFAGKDEVAVSIRCRCPKHLLVLEVRDDGPGVDDRDLPLVFNPFFTTKPVGVGMGLPKVKRIAVDHKGEVAMVPPAKGKKGCLVMISLPQPTEAAGMCGPATTPE